MLEYSHIHIMICNVHIMDWKKLTKRIRKDVEKIFTNAQ